MKIILDNIIFSIQRSGGISIVWKEFVQRLLLNKTFEIMVIEYCNSINNIFRNKMIIDESIIIKRSCLLLSVARYINPMYLSLDKCIFHSSYYRIAHGKNIINVTTVHDFTYEYFFNGLSKWIHIFQKKRAILKSDGIICVSESTKNDLLLHIPSVDKKKIVVIYNGVDDKFKRIDVLHSINKYHVFDDFEYVLYVGDHTTKYKNFDLAVSACRLQNIKLLIIGGRAFTKKEINYLDGALGKNNYKQLLDVAIDDLNKYYNRAFCLLYPSLYEGFGIPIVEAQKAGCPVIATYTSSIPEVIADMNFAIKDPTPEKIVDKMNHLKLDSEYRNIVIEKGFEKSNSFSWDRTYEQTINFYIKLFNES